MTTVAGTGCQTLIQLTVNPRFRGRVLSVWTMMAMGVPAAGAAVVGASVDGFGFVWVSAVTGTIGLGVLGLLYFKRSVLLAGTPEP